MECTFEQYWDMVLQRNIETHDDGHLIVFQYPEYILHKRKNDYFTECWKDGLSPYKALTFFEFNEEKLC
jgi:alpha-acetolactate decarboxylase